MHTRNVSICSHYPTTGVLRRCCHSIDLWSKLLISYPGPRILRYPARNTLGSQNEGKQGGGSMQQLIQQKGTPCRVIVDEDMFSKGSSPLTRDAADLSQILYPSSLNCRLLVLAHPPNPRQVPRPGLRQLSRCERALFERRKAGGWSLSPYSCDCPHRRPQSILCSNLCYTSGGWPRCSAPCDSKAALAGPGDADKTPVVWPAEGKR